MEPLANSFVASGAAEDELEDPAELDEEEELGDELLDEELLDEELLDEELLDEELLDEELLDDDEELLDGLAAACLRSAVPEAV
jgi:hypothetical protein